MYSHNTLLKALDVLYPEHMKNDTSLPAAVKEAAVNAFVSKVDNVHVDVIREALKDLHSDGMFRYVTDVQIGESIPEGVWVPARKGDRETFYTRFGRHLALCYNASLDKYAYLDVEKDVILSDEEAKKELGISNG